MAFKEKFTHLADVKARDGFSCVEGLGKDTFILDRHAPAGKRRHLGFERLVIFYEGGGFEGWGLCLHANKIKTPGFENPGSRFSYDNFLMVNSMSPEVLS